MRYNREAFERWRIVPRMLRGVPQRALATSVVGTQLSSPLLLAPIGAASVVAANSDVIIARGAAAAGTAYIISWQGCNEVEETAAAMGPWPFWYQLYWSTDEALVDSMISRAERSGAGALVVTLDTTILGWRPQDLNLGSLPFVGGQGLAQYTSDPRFLKIVQDRIASVVVALGQVSALVRRVIGRPYVYGLAIAGADGVRQVIENIVAELDLTMGLLGIQTNKDLSRDLLIANEDQMGAAAVK